MVWLFSLTDRFHVNDVDNEVISRNVILLDIICSINPDDLGDVEFLWDVWYNMTLTEGHYKRLQVVLERLLNGSSSSQWKFGDSMTKKQVVMTWKCWLETEPWDVENIKKNRQDYFAFYHKLYKISPSHSMSMPIESFCKDQRLEQMQSTLSDHLAEWNDLYQTGIARDFVCSSNINGKEFINPTMMRPGSSKWHVHYGLNQIAAYVPFDRLSTFYILFIS